MIVLDTNVTSELMRDAPSAAVTAWVRACPVAIRFTTAICLAEVRAGIERLPAGRRRDRLDAAAREIFTISESQILPFDAAAALEYAAIVSHRERSGAPIGILDAQIASICRVHGAAIATRNVSDFRDTGITVVDPWTEPGPGASSADP